MEGATRRSRNGCSLSDLRRHRITRLMRAPKSALVIALGTSMLGCGSPAVPIPRHPIIPVPITNLSARQVDDTVLLDFTLPATSTDQQPLAEAPSVEIYRHTTVQGVPAVSKRGPKNRNMGQLVDSIPADALPQYQKDGGIEFPAKLDPSELSNETGTEVVYSVRTSISAAKESTDSNPVSLRVYPPPSPVQDLRAMLTETALVLDWNSPQQHANAAAKPVAFHIYRAEVDPASAQAAVLDPSQAKLIAPPALLAQTTEMQYRDASAQFGHTYFYSVRDSVEFGTETVESADSAPAVLTAKDIFPPATPQGLEAVLVPATNGRPASVELTWTISTEADLSGYNVYRSERADMSGLKLNTEILSAPTFHDMSVLAGKSYYYRVAAVDQSGNESALSPAVEAQVPEP